MPVNEKSKFEPKEKKFSVFTESWVFKQKTLGNLHFSNKLNFFSLNLNFYFLHEATQSDHIRWLYKFEQCKNFLVVLGVVDMCHLLLNIKDFSSKPIFDLLQTLAVCNSAVKQCQGKYLGVWLLVALRLILRLTHYTACSTFFQDINSMG